MGEPPAGPSRGAQRRQARSDMYAVSTDQPQISDFSFQRGGYGGGGSSGATTAAKTCQKCLSKDHWTYECKASSAAYMSRPSRSAFLQGEAHRSRQYSGPVAPPPEAIGRPSYLLRPGNPVTVKAPVVPAPPVEVSPPVVLAGGGSASRGSEEQKTGALLESLHPLLLEWLFVQQLYVLHELLLLTVTFA